MWIWLYFNSYFKEVEKQARISKINCNHMWNYFSRVFNSFDECNFRQFNILISGPASSGRTAFILRHLKGKYVDPVTVEKIDMIKIKRENCFLNIFDVDVFSKYQKIFYSSKSKGEFYAEDNFEVNFCRRKKREIETNQNNKAMKYGNLKNKFDGILFFVDSSDHGRIPLARKLLSQLLLDIVDEKSAILVLATKQDVLGALTPGELAVELKIEEIIQTFGNNDREYAIIGISSYNGLGCNEALNWIVEAIWKKQTFLYCIPFNTFFYRMYNYNFFINR